MFFRTFQNIAVEIKETHRTELNRAQTEDWGYVQFDQ